MQFAFPVRLHNKGKKFEFADSLFSLSSSVQVRRRRREKSSSLSESTPTPSTASTASDAAPPPGKSRQRVKKSTRKSSHTPAPASAALAPRPEDDFQPPPLRPAEPHRTYRRQDAAVAPDALIGALDVPGVSVDELGDGAAHGELDDLLLLASASSSTALRRAVSDASKLPLVASARSNGDAVAHGGDVHGGDAHGTDVHGGAAAAAAAAAADGDDMEDGDDDDGSDLGDDDGSDLGDDEQTDSSVSDDDAGRRADAASFFAGWLRGSRIGRGAFGEVYMGLNVDTGALFAEKVIELDYFDGGGSGARDADTLGIIDEELDGLSHNGRHRSRLNGRVEGVAEQISEARREIDLMRQLTHEHIVQYLGTKLTRHALSIYLEYISGGSILALLKRFGPFPARLACNYTRQTLLGLAYLHGRNVIHRDIKSANLLVTEKGCVKLADFGCSKNVLSTLSLGARRRSSAQAGGDVDETVMRGTPNFMAPEVITKSQFLPPSDVWSLGATVLEMLTGHAPFGSGRDENIATVLFRIASLTAPPHAEYPRELDNDPDLTGFLDCCFAIDPSLRATATALIEYMDERDLSVNVKPQR
jgi:mitogen-activated protein kinase kinase kinase